MTRTHLKHYRAYVNGVDLSGQSRTIGALAHVFGADNDAAMTDESRNIVLGQADIQAGTLSAFLENDAASLFANKAQGTRNLLVAITSNDAISGAVDVKINSIGSIGGITDPAGKEFWGFEFSLRVLEFSQ